MAGDNTPARLAELATVANARKQLWQEKGAVATEIVWCVIECMEITGSFKTPHPQALGLIRTVCDTRMDFWKLAQDLAKGLVPNVTVPSFADATHWRLGSPVTADYLVRRSVKNAAAGLFKLGGTVASTVTLGVDVGTAALGAQSLALTGSHIASLIEMREHANETVKAWIDICLAAKAVKAAIRGTETVMACIPGASPAAKIVTSCIKAMTKIGATLTLHHAIDKMAMEVHKAANAELGGGPATRIMREIFTRRGAAGKLFGPYDLPSLIKEPAGWMALADKLKLI